MAELKSANSARPGSVGSPVPGNDEAAALDAFLSQQKAPALPSAGGGAPDEAAALDQFTSQSQGQAAAPSPSLMQQATDAGKTALDTAGRALDYGGGIVRGGLAEVAGLASGQPNLVTPGDIKNIAIGKGPNSAEYLRRLGVSEGGSLNLPGIGKTTVRGAEGLAFDIATDPLTAISKLIKEAPYIGKLINSPGRASEALGEAVYKSALPKGAEDAAQALIENGAPVGGPATLAKKVDNISSSIGKVRQGLYDKANDLGVSIDTGFPLKNAEAVIERMSRNPGLQPVSSELNDLLSRYKAAGKVSLEQMSEWKTSLYDSLPKSAFDNFGKLKGSAQQFKAALASDFRSAIINAGNTAEKGLGDSINTLNEKWGPLLDAAKPLDKAAEGGSSKLGQMIDGAVLATGGIKAAALKKAYDLATSSTAKTAIGKALMEAGRAGVANRAIIDANQAVNPVKPK